MSCPILLIRTDASPEIGVGHVMRCLALTQEWQSHGGRVLFAMAEGAEDLGERLRSEGVHVERIKAPAGSANDAGEAAQLFARSGAGWTILDGYHFSVEYHNQIAKRIRPLLLMDDGDVRRHLPCNIVVNTDPDATDDLYRDGEQSATCLVGPNYALLRREFLRAVRKDATVSPVARRVLITLGGGDAENVTLQVLEAFEGVKDLDLELTVVVGASNPNMSSLEAAARKSSHKVAILFDVRDMPGLMNNCDLAITAGGGTCYELAFMQVPMFLVTTAKNHERVVAYLGQSEVAYAAGWYNSLLPDALAASLRKVVCDRALREKIVSNARRMVDGKGAERIVEVMLDLSRNLHTKTGARCE